MRTLGRLAVAGIAVFALLQFVRPGIPTKPPVAEVNVPPQVRSILEKDCYSCHSDQRRLSWFDQIVPGYWLVRHDILTAREHLNFSTLGSKPTAMQRAALFETVNMIQLGAMPLPQFLKLHPQAKVSPEDLATLKAYLAPWTPPANQPGNMPATTGPEPPSLTAASLAMIQPEPGGFPFDSTFPGWKLISTTDRGDNNTFRLILGNDIAVDAAHTGNISPWPDGARFAKIAWRQELGPDGLLHPGKFVQVEFMVKDAHQYKDSEGWGWGRWLGANLKPYGEDIHYANECTSCHQPLRGNDYVYTLPVSSANIDRNEVVNNAAATLPASLPYQPLGWSPITMYVDPKSRTTAVLFGNLAAIQAVQALRANSTASANAPEYPAGAVLALITWAQRDDPHWFGARIPDQPQSMEFVTLSAGAQSPGYRRFAGQGLAEDPSAAGRAAMRSSFVLNLAAPWLP